MKNIYRVRKINLVYESLRSTKVINNLLLILIFSLLINEANGQQDPLSSQYLNNYFTINPAYAGTTKDLNLSVGYRTQWAGFAGSPVTANATGHISLAQNKMGLGFSVVEDKIGSNNTTEANLAYAYHIRFKKDLMLSFGLQAGMINYKSDYSSLNLDPADPKFTNISEFKPNIGSGIILKNEKFLFSISVPHMLKPTNDATSITTGLYAQNLFVLGAYLLPVSYRIKLKPSVLLRSVSGAPVSVDYGMSMRVDNSYSLGLFTRDFNTMGFMAQINVGDALRFGYVFELPTNKSVGLNFTSHEITFGLRLKALRIHDLNEVRGF